MTKKEKAAIIEQLRNCDDFEYLKALDLMLTKMVDLNELINSISE